jgi:predicted RecA/RadA family phage recombinase
MGVFRYTVPHKKRVIVTSVIAVTFDVVPAGVAVVIAQKYVTIFSLPDAYSSYPLEMKVVAYAGEQVVVEKNTGPSHVTITGYVFDDLIGPPATTKPGPDGEDEDWESLPPGWEA